MARDTSEELNLRHICWKDDAWLGYHGMLSTITALSYFSYSPFYDGQPVAPSRPIQKLYEIVLNLYGRVHTGQSVIMSIMI